MRSHCAYYVLLIALFANCNLAQNTTAPATSTAAGTSSTSAAESSSSAAVSSATSVASSSSSAAQTTSAVSTSSALVSSSAAVSSSTTTSTIPTGTPSPSGACGAAGTMRCTTDGNFETCLPSGTWQKMQCPPGTTCRSTAFQPALCDYASAAQTLPSTVQIPAGMPFVPGTGAPQGGFCTDGVFVCSGADFYKCDHSAWVLFKCAPGTACKQTSPTVILCDFPGAGAGGGSTPSPSASGGAPSATTSAGPPSSAGPPGGSANDGNGNNGAGGGAGGGGGSGSTTAVTSSVRSSTTTASSSVLSSTTALSSATSTSTTVATSTGVVSSTGTATGVISSTSTATSASSQTGTLVTSDATSSTAAATSTTATATQTTQTSSTATPTSTSNLPEPDFIVQVAPNGTDTFSPANLTVPLNTVVQYLFPASNPKNHTVVDGENCVADSVTGFTYNKTAYYYFNQTGNFTYFSSASGACQAGMTGVVSVGAAQTRVYRIQVGPGQQPKYDPALLRIWVNSTVEFVFSNGSTVPYTVTEGAGCTASTDPAPLFNLNRTSRVVFQNTGTYNFFSLSPGDCDSGMKGSIIVIPPNFDDAGQFINGTAVNAASLLDGSASDIASAMAVKEGGEAAVATDSAQLSNPAQDALVRSFGMAVANGDPVEFPGVYYF